RPHRPDRGSLGARRGHHPLRGADLRLRPGHPRGARMTAGSDGTGASGAGTAGTGATGESDGALELHTRDGDGTRVIAHALAAALRPGDLLVLDGPLGAGKTTFTQGLGQGLGVRGPVASPTFVIERVHPNLAGGPDLVHVDAYRLGGTGEIDDLDLEADLDRAVTVVEWGRDRVEHLEIGRASCRERGQTRGR